MDGREMGGFAPDLDAWDAWRPEEVAARLVGVDVPWCVVGGWALDLFLGGQRREHGDLEIAVPADRFEPVAEALPELEFFIVGSGMTWPPAGNPALFREHRQTWGRDRATALWRVDVMREPHQGETWIARRDARIRMPYADLILRTDAGIPFARPEVILFFKAFQSSPHSLKRRHVGSCPSDASVSVSPARPKDEDDFAAVLPALSPEARRWLREALALVHPGHMWLGELS